MDPRRFLVAGFQVVLAVAVLALILGSFLGQPILLGFVETGSMEPTLNPGDGFVAVPSPLAGEIESGDVVVFRAEEIQGGGLTTHRVVGVTDEGYITRGDANPFTDQDGGEPVVKDAQIVAVVWQPGGEVFVIPQLGLIVGTVASVIVSVQRLLATTFGTRSLLGAQGLAYLFFAVSAVVYAVDWYREKEDRQHSRSRERNSGTDPRLYAAGVALLVVIAATAAMVGPGGTQEYGVVSAEFQSDRPNVIQVGQSKNIEYPVVNSGLVPIVAYVEPGSDGVTISPRRLRVGTRGTEETSVTLYAEDTTGFYRRFVTEHRYLAVLPTPVIDSLYEIHPWLPILVIDAIVGLPFYLLGMAALGSGRVRRRDSNRPSRLDRLLSRFT